MDKHLGHFQECSVELATEHEKRAVQNVLLFFLPQVLARGVP
jgi:hypothetical protein